jgi:hypothetical protein
MGIHEGIVYLHNRKAVDTGVLLGNSLAYLGVCAVCGSALVAAVWVSIGPQAFFGLDAFGVVLLVVTTLLLMVVETLTGFVLAQHRYDQYSLNMVLQNVALIGRYCSCGQHADLRDTWPGASLRQRWGCRFRCSSCSPSREGMLRGDACGSAVVWTEGTVQLILALLNFRFYLYALIFFVDTEAAGQFSVIVGRRGTFAPNALGLVRPLLRSESTARSTASRPGQVAASCS